MASLTRWTWVWASSGSWWWTGNPGVCGVTMSRTWLSNWTELNWPPKSNSLGVLVPLACPQVQKSVVGYRIFLIVQESLWYNWSALYGVIFWAASWWGQWWPPLRVLMLYPACPRSAAARAPVPVGSPCCPMPQQKTLRHSKAGLAQFQWGFWVLVCTSFCLSPLSFIQKVTK